MADFTALKSAIQTYIKQNGNEEITGEKLQEILLSMVTTLGDSAINDLITALNDEVAARQNADGTLQQNITNEATARGNADTALGGRIDDEATARANGDTALANRLGSSITAENTAADQIGAEAEARAAADTALQELIDGITNNIENGYVYAGIATPSSTPATGKVFYLALTAGTYTNFGNTEVSQGINILKYNGSAWLLDAFIGIDDTPTPNSPKLVKSGGVAEELALGAVYDVSAKNPTAGPNNDGKWESLSALLSDANLNTLIPTAVRKGGMSIKFVRTSDNNKYVQFRYMLEYENTTVGNANFINPDNWQGVDVSPVAGSKNLVESRGVYREVEKTEESILQLNNNVGSSMPSTTDDLALSDDYGNKLVVFKDGHIKTKKFDSKDVTKTSDTNEVDLNISDENDNVLAEFANGQFRVKYFDSSVFAANFNQDKIGFIGDSICWGSAGSARADKRWTVIFCNKVNATENNASHGDWGFCDLNSMGLYRNVPQLDVNCKAVFIAAGINDFMNAYPIGDLYITEDRDTHPSYDVNTFAGGLNRLIKDIRDRVGIKPIYVITPLHKAHPSQSAYNLYYYQKKNSIGLYLSDYVNTIKEIASWYSIPVIDMYANSQMNAENPDFCDFFFADGLHPNAKGHEYYGRFITKWFNVNYISF